MQVCYRLKRNGLTLRDETWKECGTRTTGTPPPYRPCDTPSTWDTDCATIGLLDDDGLPVRGE